MRDSTDTDIIAAAAAIVLDEMYTVDEAEDALINHASILS